MQAETFLLATVTHDETSASWHAPSRAIKSPFALMPDRVQDHAWGLEQSHGQARVGFSIRVCPRWAISAPIGGRTGGTQHLPRDIAGSRGTLRVK
jgi:hypothetical protein